MNCRYKDKDGKCRKENIMFCIGEACPLIKPKRRVNMSLAIAFFLGAFCGVMFLAMCISGGQR